MARYRTRSEYLRSREVPTRHVHRGPVEVVRTGHGTETLLYTGCGHKVTVED